MTNSAFTELNKNLFEVFMRDEFLPIYTHSSYLQMFKDNSLAMEKSSPNRKSSPKKSNGGSQKGSVGRKSQASPIKSSGGKNLDLNKKSIDSKESPSKNSKIAMKYINSYNDVGPVIAQPKVNIGDLETMARDLNKKEMWVKSDMRLVFSLKDG